MKNLSILSIILFTNLASAQEEKKVAPKIPTDPNIRPAGEIVLEFEHKVKVPKIKRFDKGVLELFPGDTVHLEFKEVKGELVNPKVVAKVRHPKRTITFGMTQDKAITGLSRTTKIQKTVALDCEHRTLGNKEFTSTNIYPTEKGIGGYDSWSNTTWIIRLSNIEVTSKSASEVYEKKVGIKEPTEPDKKDE